MIMHYGILHEEVGFTFTKSEVSIIRIIWHVLHIVLSLNYSNCEDNNNHRTSNTLQFHKDKEGIIRAVTDNVDYRVITS